MGTMSGGRLTSGGRGVCESSCGGVVAWSLGGIVDGASRPGKSLVSGELVVTWSGGLRVLVPVRCAVWGVALRSVARGGVFVGGFSVL